MSFKLAVLIAIIPALALGASIAPSSINDVVVGAQACIPSEDYTGAFISIDLEGCSQSPCNVRGGGNYEIGLTFMPLANIQSLYWRPFVLNNLGQIRMLADIRMDNVNLNGTLAYRISNRVTMTPLSYHYDGLGELSVMLVNGENDVRIACGIFNIIVSA